MDFQIVLDMMNAANEDQFDAVEIWAGDKDYVPLVEDIKRKGKRVICCFFNEDYGLSKELKQACDEYRDVSDWVIQLREKFQDTLNLSKTTTSK